MEITTDIHFTDNKSFSRHGRPEWPYQDWKYVPNDRDTENESTNIEHGDKDIVPDLTQTDIFQTSVSTSENLLSSITLDTYEPESKFVNASEQAISPKISDDWFEPDHWTDDLDKPTDEMAPLNRLIAYLNSQASFNVEEGKKIFEALSLMMNETANELKSKYIVFERCYVMPVGSFMENTKVGRADEFDFAICLPYFETFDKFYSILCLKEEDKLLNDPDFIALAEDMSSNQNVRTVLENFQASLKRIWTLYMLDHVAKGWELSESNCHEDEDGIAGTFHLTRSEDGFIVDIDVCFWTPIDKTALEKIDDRLMEQKHFLLENCLDEDLKIYAVLQKDHNIDYSLNTVRFAMSLKERKELNKFGEENGRIKSYKLAKCIANCFLPKVQKRNNCEHCLDSVVSSFCLKNIIFYMLEKYQKEDMWTNEQLGNRVLEIFSILNFCMKVNCSVVSAYFTPYLIQLGTLSWKYNPMKKVIADVDNVWTGYNVDPCFVPDLKNLETLFDKDQVSKQIITNYSVFISQSEWNVPELIDRLHEMLSGLRESDEEERREFAENPGCLCFPSGNVESGAHFMSVDTKL